MSRPSQRLYAAALEGIDANIIEVETDINVGLHSFTIVGLGDRSLIEAKERVNSAVKNSGIKPPNRENRRITINLAPAHIKKTGSHYDLAIAIGYLLATKQIRTFKSDDKLFLGELALDGRLRPVSGALNIAQRAAAQGIAYLFLPRENAREASVIKKMKVIPLESLKEAIAFLEGSVDISPVIFAEERADRKDPDENFSDIKGQGNAKRALVVAAAGGHNILLVGPPGVGKTFLSRALAGILPDLSLAEAIETTKIWSAAGLSPGNLIFQRPFRAPHHSSSVAALMGGGPDFRPGEISLAHQGVLFFDELPEFPKNAIEALRQPMESGTVHVARTKGFVSFPSKFIFVAAMNPCPCGYYGDPEKECRCSAYEVLRYQKKVSGPVLDRIDLQVKVGRPTPDDPAVRKDSAAMKAMALQAREAQKRRFVTAPISPAASPTGRTNAEMTTRETQALMVFDAEAQGFLASLRSDLLSPRAYYRTIKVARTIADLDQKEKISAEHLAEAFSYRLREVF